MYVTDLVKSINRRVAVIAHDLLMVGLAWLISGLMRTSVPGVEDQWVLTQFQVLPVVLMAQGLVLWWSGLYRGLWRFASIPDLWNIIRAVTVGLLAVCLALFLVNRLDGVPRSSLVLYPTFLAFLLGAPRLLYRMWKDHTLNPFDPEQRQRVLILGAGRAGELLARDMLREGQWLPVGFLDDKSRLKGAKVHGIPVLGSIEDLPRLAKERSIDLVVIALPTASSAQMRRVVSYCEDADVAFRTLPRLHDLLSGGASVKELREVAIEDLLGREPVSLDWERLSGGLGGKTILVSGGGGSIGSELCRQLARLGPSSLVLLEFGEYNLYHIEMELRRDFPALTLHPCLGDVCDRATVDYVMQTYRPQVVFHAAAYKHVPLLQGQVREAVRNNVLGTRTLALAADRHGCESFVMVSTDKAVNPTNYMGAAKRIAEIFCQNLDRRSATRFITVRFGNVLGSGGSVVPLFRRQIAGGGPVTVTHPQITRYFMTITEACQLVMQAGVMGKGGEIFVLDMGHPVSIRDLAEQMIRLSGRVPGEDIQIVYTGLRPGEKLFEELFHAQENLSGTDHEKILLAHHRTVDWVLLNEVIQQTERACAAYDQPRIKDLVKMLVPELRDAEAQPAVPLVALNRISA